MIPLYFYKVRSVHRVVDGDTYDLEIDLGFHQYGILRFRLLGVDTPEKYGRNASEDGQVATDFAASWLDLHDGHLTVHTQKSDSFGRWLADVMYDDPDGTIHHLSDALLEAGLATPWVRR